MTSIIKVDQIQTAAGAAPTAADLGINVTGNVLKTHYMKSPDANQVVVTADNTGNTWTTIDTLSVTTIGESSRLVIFFDTAQFVKSAADANASFRFLVDNVPIAMNTEFGHHHWHIGYGSNSAREAHFGWYVSGLLSAGTHTILQQGGAYGDSVTFKYQGRYQRYMIQEIAG
jgi:hypothetical protein